MWRPSLLFLSLIGSTGLIAPAQAPAAPSTPPLTARDAAGMNGQPVEEIMRLDVVVTDKGGKVVPGLGAGDFQLLDNGRPMEILSFKAYGPSSPPADPPASVIIVFDTVNMPFESVSYTREQVGAFLRQNGGRLAFPVSLAFLTNEGIQMQSEPETDGEDLARNLEATAGHLRTVDRSAGTWGAIERYDFCIRMLTTLVDSIKNKPGRKLVIWAGPGWPMLDNPGIDFSMKGQKAIFDSIVHLNTVMREGQIELSSVTHGMPDAATYLYESFLKGVRKPNQALPPSLALKVLAIQSGGRVLPPSNDVTSEIATIVQDAGTYYEITFEPPRPDGPNEYHELKVKLGQAGLAAHTDAGYYGQPTPPLAP